MLQISRGEGFIQFPSKQKEPHTPIVEKTVLVSNTPAYEIKDVDDLSTFLTSFDDGVIFFYNPTCPYCKEFAPLFREMAQMFHKTNLYENSHPYIFAQFNAFENIQAVSEMMPGLYGGPEKRGYPTVIFKRCEPNEEYDGKTKMVTISFQVFDDKKVRSFENIMEEMKKYYDDASLEKEKRKLHTLMKAKKPEFIYFYDNSSPLYPRFISPLIEHVIDLPAEMATMTSIFLNNPELAKGGLALPTNEMDRPDIKVPSIYLVETDENFAYRDAATWLLHRMS